MTLPKFLRWLFYRRISDPKQFTTAERLAFGMRNVNQGRRK